MTSNSAHLAVSDKQGQGSSHKGSTIFEPYQTVNGSVPALQLPLDRPADTALGLSSSSVDRRASLTPESPYKTSSETRARTDLLDHDEAEIGSTTTIGGTGASHHHHVPPSNSRGSAARSSLHSTTIPHAKSVNQVMGKASEMIGELAGIVAGVLPGLGGHDGGGSSHAGHDPDAVRFFVSSPETSRRESLQPGYASEIRRASFTPESPYNVSDETRHRTNSLESDLSLVGVSMLGQHSAPTEVRRSSGEITSAKYKRLG